MNYKLHNWYEFKTTFLKTFDKDVPIYTPSNYREYRGEIFTTYHSELHPVNQIIDVKSVIHNRFSKSYQNVLRGLHYDYKTWKLVQAVIGDIYLVVVDMRPESQNYKKWESYIITERTRDQVLIPPGFANGHYALTDCVFHYTMFYTGSYVDEKSQSVLRWNDNSINIDWPCTNPILQGRDK